MKIEFYYDPYMDPHMSLNPCCNGMKIEYVAQLCEERWQPSLKPCCNGMKIEYLKMEVIYGNIESLNPCCNGMKIEFVDVTSFEDYWRS